MKKLINELFPVIRSIVGEGQRIFLERLAEEVPLRIHSFASGTECFDWKIPPEWRCQAAVLSDIKGKVIADAKLNHLHVLNYSQPFEGVVKMDELAAHLFTDERMPGAVPYRTSYYAKNWGFCLSARQYRKMTDEAYRVDIKSSFLPGNLYIGELYLPGKSKREVLLSSYICHPLQANDGLSGVILLTQLYKLLKRRKLNYSYRFVFLPETIGSLTLLSQGLIEPRNIEYALVATCVGAGTKVNYKKTYLGNHSIDNIALDVISKREKQFVIMDFLPIGSDERQYSSAGIRIPTASIMRSPYGMFKQYHTSADDLKLISADRIEAMTELYYEIIRNYEKQKKIIVKLKGGEPFLTKYNLYRPIGGKVHDTSHLIRNWIIHLSDGTRNELDISKKINMPLEKIKPLIKELLDKDVIGYVDGE